MKPSIGRIVHVGVSGFAQPLAGIITRVDERPPPPSREEPTIALAEEHHFDVFVTVFPPGSGASGYRDSLGTEIPIPFSAVATAGCWTWPPR